MMKLMSTALIAAGLGLPAALGLPGLLGSAGTTSGNLPAPSAVGTAPQGVEATAPKVIVIKYHAEWCGKCKALAGPLAEARANLADQPVLFVTFDFTDKAQASQSEYLASVVGFGETWSQYERQTGFALIVNPSTRQVVGEIRTADAAAIEKAIREQL
jgi:thiol-disulfide isomerase/thioredoxin